VTGVIGSAPFARLVSGIALLVGLAALAIAAQGLRRVAAPAQRIVDAAQRIESGDYSARVPVRGPGEMRSVARALNAMSSRLEAEEVRRRSVLTDVAHELRTPLTIIRGQAEGIVDGVYPPDPDQMLPILAATRTLEVVVEQLRAVALADSGGLRLEREPVDVQALVDETLDAFRGAAGSADVRLVASVDREVPPIEADGARLSSVVANLVSNALRHTGRGGTVEVRAVARAGDVVLTVRDDGEGIPPELLPRVFDRFVKGSGSTGSGLGLAIVRDVVEAHGGSVSAQSTPGEGTAVQVVLPVRGGGDAAEPV
jgi:two-component system sensor histidine kinase BaeS